MNFLNSAILLGLAAVAMPLLIHLFTRAKAKPIPFSSLQFIKQLQSQKIRQVKIRQILLLITRTLAILFLVLSFARPTCRSSPATARSSTCAVILLDNSVSMLIEEEGEQLFSSAKRVALDIVEQMQPGDEVFLCTTTDTLQPESRRAFHDFQAYRRQVEAMRPDYSATNLSAGMIYAQNLLASAHNVNKEIYLLSDMQANGFSLDSLPRRDFVTRHFAVPFQAQHAANLSITGVELRSSILQPDKAVEIEVTLANSGKDPGRSKLVQVYIHDQRVAQRAVTVQAEGAAKELFRFIVDRTGWIDGYVQLEDDALMEDNLRYFSFYVPEQINLGVIGEGSAGNRLFQLALLSSADSSTYIKIQTLPESRLSGLAIDSVQIVVLYNVIKMPAEAVNRIAEWYERGGSVMVVLGPRLDVRWYNSSLAPALSLPAIMEPLGAGSGFSLGRIDASHPVFAGIFESNEVNFTRPRFNFAFRTGPVTHQHILLAYSTGDPYLSELREKNGAVLLFTSSFEPEESDIAYRTIFAPLLHRSVSYLASHGQNRRDEYFSGDALRFRVPGQELQSRLEIESPDGQVDLVHPQITASGTWIDYTSTKQPGIYHLRSNGKTLTLWAVNIPVEELRLDVAEREHVEETHRLTWVDNPGQIDVVIRDARIGREYWREFLVAVLVLLLLEMALYREKGEVTSEA